MTCSLTLPWPPSVNAVYSARGGLKCRGQRRLSDTHRRYRQLVALTIAGHRNFGSLPRVAFTGPLSVTITVHAPTRRARDLDNLGKAPLDALTHAGVWGDDSQIDRLTFVRADVVKGGRLVVEIEPIHLVSF